MIFCMNFNVTQIKIFDIDHASAKIFGKTKRVN